MGVLLSFLKDLRESPVALSYLMSQVVNAGIDRLMTIHAPILKVHAPINNHNTMRHHMLKEFYKPNEITDCPSCGGAKKDLKAPHCWHCAECGFAICAHYKDEVDEIRKRRDKIGALKLCH